MKSISFQKMHALGNDFIVIDHRHASQQLQKTQLLHLADRHLGIGCDQILILTSTPTADVYCRIYNQDGSEAEQCGNGLRCIARYLSQEKNQGAFQIATIAGIFTLDVLDEKLVRMNMGVPQLNLQPLTLHFHSSRPITLNEIQVGNPHVITELDHNPLDDHHLTELGQWISTHSHFKHGVNVGFIHIVNGQKIQLKTYERGAGWTLSCGSNATASAAYFFQIHPEKNEVVIEQQYGLLIAARQKNNGIEITGEAVISFRGMIEMSDEQTGLLKHL